MSTFLFFPESDYYVYIEFNFRSSLHKGPYIYDIHENVYLFTHPLPNSPPPLPSFSVGPNGSKLGETPTFPGRRNLGYLAS